ncbi:MAG: 50S ribosomal protein L32 [Bdellovibrio sp.]|nr:50S ribosomal protein L32 [Bdellovibrio sp.]
MAVPKKKTSVSRKGMRHAGQHHKLSAKTVGRDATTGDYVLPHRVNPATGMYKGVKIFTSRAEKLALKAEAEAKPE